MGSAALVAEYSGIEREDHVRSKLAHLIGVAELVYGCGIAGAVKSTKTPRAPRCPTWSTATWRASTRERASSTSTRSWPTSPGACPLPCPTTQSSLSPEVGDLVKKYLKRVDSVSVEDIFRCYSLDRRLHLLVLGGGATIRRPARRRLAGDGGHRHPRYLRHQLEEGDRQETGRHRLTPSQCPGSIICHTWINDLELIDGGERASITRRASMKKTSRELPGNPNWLYPFPAAGSAASHAC